jgi:nucleoside-diphosphate-sugar epimerase
MNVFITGSTGFIGGSIAVRLVAAGHHVRGLVRTEAQAAQISELGIKPVLGDLADSAILTREARSADAVVNAASSDDPAAVEIFIDALSGTGKTFIHTSGTSVIADNANGEWAGGTVYDEDTLFTPVPEKAQRAALDKQVISAATERGLHSIVLCNSLIYGHGFGLKPHSAQIPLLLAQARQSGVARHVGHGLNIWSNVHIEDVSELYLLALNHAPPGSFYYVENGEASFAEITAAIAERLGLGAPQGWPIEEASREWGFSRAAYSFGSNSRVSSRRARTELGWKPKHGSASEWIKTGMVL